MTEEVEVGIINEKTILLGGFLDEVNCLTSSDVVISDLKRSVNKSSDVVVGFRIMLVLESSNEVPAHPDLLDAIELPVLRDLHFHALDLIDPPNNVAIIIMEAIVALVGKVAR